MPQRRNTGRVEDGRRGVLRYLKHLILVEVVFEVLFAILRFLLNRVGLFEDVAGSRCHIFLHLVRCTGHVLLLPGQPFDAVNFVLPNSSVQVILLPIRLL